MGLQSQLNDVSSDSIPLLVIALIANFICYLRSLIFTFLQFMGITRFHESDVDEGLLEVVGSGLAGLIDLAEQLNINRLFSYRFGEEEDGPMVVSDCVVCLSGLRNGDQVRKLACRHVFHKECFDGWLDHLNFNCPLCRSPLVAAASADARVNHTAERRVGRDLASWFSLRGNCFRAHPTIALLQSPPSTFFYVNLIMKL